MSYDPDTNETTVDPAERPKEPGGQCGDVPERKQPEYTGPEKSTPDELCCCPSTPTTSPSCLDELIAAQSKQLSEAESAKTFKSELEALLKTAKTASQEYTPEKYQKLVTEWEKQDGNISAFIHKLVCAVPCWKCLIECFVCPLLYEVRYREQKIWGGELYSEVHSLSDLRYWHDRNRADKKRAYDRIKAVLLAWEKPAQTIEKALTDNAKLLADVGPLLSSDATKVVYDVFLRLVPMHLIIAPPAVSPGYTTKIDKKYTQFCEHDKGETDDCCGPDVGEPSVRRRLLGPQPYLIDPKQYFGVICCLAKERYLPAKNAYAAAQAAWESVDSEIKRLSAEIEEKMKPQAIEKDAKAVLPANCDWLKKAKESAI